MANFTDVSKDHNGSSWQIIFSEHPWIKTANGIWKQMAILFCSMWFLVGWVYKSLVAHAADVDLFHWVGHHFIDIILNGCYIY